MSLFSKNEKIVLYQFFISHFCEKARWGLDHKGLSYQTVNLIPGTHLLTTKRLASESTVPILVHQRKVIQDSTLILSYLDETFPQRPLSPSNESLRKEALELEEYLDREVGIYLRLYLYYHLLQERELAKALLLQNAPWYGHSLYAGIFPIVRAMMAKNMKLDSKSAQNAERHLVAALNVLNRLSQGRRFLVGKHFSRTDITAASLLAPLCLPSEHAVSWPPVDLLPEPLRQLRKQYIDAPFFRWVLNTYHYFRHPLTLPADFMEQEITLKSPHGIFL